MSEKTFPKGIYAKAPHEKVKGWTLANISVKVADAIPWLKEHENVAGYVNLIVKYNDKGVYIEKDTWIALNRATEQELAEVSKVINYKALRDRLNTIYGNYP